MAATYYVDAAGSDGNSGASTATPWKTISRISGRSFNPGDSILLKCGSAWRESLSIISSGTNSNRITFGSYGSCTASNAPAINGAQKLSTWTKHGNVNVWYAPVGIQPRAVWFDNTRGSKVASLAAVIAARNWFWQSGTLYVYGTANPSTLYATAGVEAAVLTNLVSLIDQSYVTIQDIQVMHSNDNGVNIGQRGSNQPTGITIQRMTIKENAADGVFSWKSGSLSVNNLVIQNNTIAQNGNIGIRIAGGSINTVARNNTVNNNCWDTTNDYTAGIKYSGNNSSGILVERNEVSFNGAGIGDMSVRGVGIWLDTVGTSSTNTVRYNNVHENNKAGIMVEDSANAQVYYNIVYNHTGAGAASRGIWIYRRATNADVYHNTVYGNRRGIEIQGTNPSNPDAVNNTVINNISVGNGCQVCGMNLGAGNTLRSNNFGAEFANFVSWKDKNYSTYAALDQSYGSSTQSIAGDPQFVNAGAKDFHLKASSPAIDAGSNVGQTQDYAGQTFIGPPDLGVFEYQSQPESTGSACDVNDDGVTNVVDTQVVINQAVGITTCLNGDIDLNGRCDVVDVQRIVNAVLGSPCQSGQ